MTQTYLAVLGNRAGNAEALQTDTDSGSGVSGLYATLLDCDSGANRVCPLCILECDGLCFFDDLIGVDTLRVANFLTFVDGGNAVFLESGKDLRLASLVSLKFCHFYIPPSIIPYGGRCT